ncbi:MAG: hypothetical protein QG597_961, partial [Actinomycetota bacterium]|nr:hypothetical protein [Actinomycetota bacterium]
MLRRRGVARTRSWAALLADRGCATVRPPAAAAPIVLELEADVWAGVPCWTGRAGRWVSYVVPIAYDLRYDTDVRPHMGGNQVSRAALLKVAAARAAFADFRTGRNCRPTVETLATLVSLDKRTVTRASKALRLLGVASEVLRGRQRTRAERLASWRVGDRARGWASVWALHDDAALARIIGTLSPHPEGSLLIQETSRKSVVTTSDRRPAGAGGRGAKRRAGPDSRGVWLAAAWRADPAAPPWARRHSANAWAAVLAAPAAAGWVSRDVTALIGDWAGVHGWLPDHPHRPIGLLGAMLAWHGDVTVRPAAQEMAREAAELAAARARIAEQLASRDRAAAARSEER